MCVRRVFMAVEDQTPGLAIEATVLLHLSPSKNTHRARRGGGELFNSDKHSDFRQTCSIGATRRRASSSSRSLYRKLATVKLKQLSRPELYNQPGSVLHATYAHQKYYHVRHLSLRTSHADAAQTSTNATCAARNVVFHRLLTK